MRHTVGVLALQGAFAKHAEKLVKLGARVVEVVRPSHLVACDALVMPGGESTVMMKHLLASGLYQAIQQFGASKPVLGTCAGAILLSREVIGHPMQPLNLLDIAVTRNAYGRQIESFRHTLTLSVPPGKPKNITGFFIRAPKITRVGPSVEVLATHANMPVFVRQGCVYAATFHPELTDEDHLHALFLKSI